MSSVSTLLTILLSTSAFFTVSCQNSTECSKCCCDVGTDECLMQDLRCTSCLDGYWGRKCSNKCPANCLACDMEPVRTGRGSYPDPVLYHICTKCVDGKYLGDTNVTKSCELSCPCECKTCTSLNNCHECKTGYYPENGKCKACSCTCNDCTSATNCTLCTIGYYGDICDQKCSVGCEDGWCDKVTGTCNCSLRFTGAKCNKCADTFYGSTCCQIHQDKEPETVPYEQHVQRISIAVTVTFILTFSLVVAAYYLLSFIRRLKATNDPKAENRYGRGQTGDTYDTLSSEPTNTGTEYDIIAARNDDYANAEM